MGKKPKSSETSTLPRHDYSKPYSGTTRCEEPQSRPINRQLAYSEEARTWYPEHRKCSFCRSTLGQSKVECACCGPLHMECSAGLNRAKDWRRGYVCGRCNRPSRVQELEENNHSSGLSQLINQMSLNDRDTENFTPDSVLNNPSTGLTQHMTKLHLNNVDTEALAGETHTPQPMSTLSPSTLTQTMAGLALNDSNQAPSIMTDAEILGHTGATKMMIELAISGDHTITSAEQTSGVLSQVSESEGLQTFPVPSGRIAANEVEKAYGVIRSMSHTLFRLPTGRAGNRFLDEMSRVLNIYIDGTHGSQNALYAFFILPALMLQKPSKNSKTKDNVNALQRRFELWCEGKVRELIKESKLLQKRMSKGKSNTSESTILRNYTNAVTSGNVGLAGKLIDGTTWSSLEPTPEVINQLKKSTQLLSQPTRKFS